MILDNCIKLQNIITKSSAYIHNTDAFDWYWSNLEKRVDNEDSEVLFTDLNENLRSNPLIRELKNAQQTEEVPRNLWITVGWNLVLVCLS